MQQRVIKTKLDYRKVKEAYKLLLLLRLPLVQEILMIISKHPYTSNITIEIHIAKTFKYHNLPQTQISTLLTQLKKQKLVEDKSTSVKSAWVITDRTFKVLRKIKKFSKQYKCNI